MNTFLLHFESHQVHFTKCTLRFPPLQLTLHFTAYIPFHNAGLELENRLFDLLGCEHLDLISMLLKISIENLPSAPKSAKTSSTPPPFGTADRIQGTIGDVFLHRDVHAAAGTSSSIAGAVWTRIDELNLTEVPFVPHRPAISGCLIPD